MTINNIYFEEIFPEYVHSYGNVICIPVIDTDEINFTLDEIRANKGKQPFYKRFNNKEIDPEAYYELRLILNKETFEPVEIEAWAEYYNEEDDEVYHLPIDNTKEILCQVINQISEFDMLLTDLRGYI